MNFRVLVAVRATVIIGHRTDSGTAKRSVRTDVNQAVWVRVNPAEPHPVCEDRVRGSSQMTRKALLGAIPLLLVTACSELHAGVLSSGNPDASPSPSFAKPSLAATPMPGPTMSLPNDQLNNVLASEGIFLYKPADGAVPDLTQEQALDVLRKSAPATSISPRSATLAIVQYAKIGRPPVLAWVFDISPETPYPVPNGPPDASFGTMSWSIRVVNAQSGSDRFGEVVWGAGGG